MPIRWILASESPQRKEILKEAGFTFEICPSRIEEKAKPEWTPEICVRELSYQKAHNVVVRLRQNPDFSAGSVSSKQTFVPAPDDDPVLVLSADTVVAMGNEIFGKPRDAGDAYQMLWRLSRNPHRVLTGVCLWPLSWDEPFLDVAETKVRMRPLSEEEIQDYIKSGEPMNKAGAYAIQGKADRYVQSLDGDYDNVVGLPIRIVQNLIEQWRNRIATGKI